MFITIKQKIYMKQRIYMIKVYLGKLSFYQDFFQG